MRIIKTSYRLFKMYKVYVHECKISDRYFKEYRNLENITFGSMIYRKLSIRQKLLTLLTRISFTFYYIFESSPILSVSFKITKLTVISHCMHQELTFYSIHYRKPHPNLCSSSQVRSIPTDNRQYKILKNISQIYLYFYTTLVRFYYADMTTSFITV